MTTYAVLVMVGKVFALGVAFIACACGVGALVGAVMGARDRRWGN